MTNNDSVPVLLQDRFLFESIETKPAPTRTGTVGTQLIDVAIPLPVEDPYTYCVPESLSGQAKTGCRVRIPIKNRSLIAYVVHQASERKVEAPKFISEVLDSEPVISDHQLRLAKWISEYYFSSWGEAISLMLPKILKPADRKADRKRTLRQERSNTSIRLNEEQEKAFSELCAHLNSNTYSEIFLFGVTGGGKSELYIRSIKEALKLGKGAICLVPEIALTEQLRLFFGSHFDQELEILHSKLTDRDRYEAWLRIRNGEKKVILGARSAVFAPVQNLGLIILDEEQETSYKQDQTPRYHAREAARWRARDLNALFVMGTATPTLETMHRVKSGETHCLTLSKRFDGRPMPEVTIIDLKNTGASPQVPSIISTRLGRAIEKALDQKSGILLMLNRRGFSTHIQCLKCGHVLFCPHCAVALTFHQNAQKAVCHYCNYQVAVPRTCAQCGHELLKFSGVGTEKVESEVARIFPKAVVARLDADAAQKRGAHETILKKFRAGEIDILVGTQMIAKGFDFPHVTLVGMIHADTGLLLPDFRSSERTFQLLTQMAGRAGRGAQKGMVYIQTYSPHHHAIQFAARHAYPNFYEEEIESRKKLNYPPFTRIINVMFRGKTEQHVYLQALEFRKLLEEEVSEVIELMGPAPLPFYRLRGQFRWHVMLKSKTIDEMQTAVRTALKRFRKKQGVYVAIDSDPVSIL